MTQMIIIMMVISTITTIQVLTIQYPIRCRSHVKVSEGMFSTMLQLVGVDTVAKGSISCMVFYSIHGAHIEVTVTNELGMNKNDIRPTYCSQRKKNKKTHLHYSIDNSLFFF